MSIAVWTALMAAPSVGRRSQARPPPPPERSIARLRAWQDLRYSGVCRAAVTGSGRRTPRLPPAARAQGTSPAYAPARGLQLRSRDLHTARAAQRRSPGVV